MKVQLRPSRLCGTSEQADQGPPWLGDSKGTGKGEPPHPENTSEDYLLQCEQGGVNRLLRAPLTLTLPAASSMPSSGTQLCWSLRLHRSVI